MRYPIWNKFVDNYIHNIEVNQTRFDKNMVHLVQIEFMLILFPWKPHIETYQMKINDFTQQICRCLEEHNKKEDVAPYICSDLDILFRSCENIF